MSTTWKTALACALLVLGACLSVEDVESSARRWAGRMGYSVERLECVEPASQLVDMVKCSLRVSEVAVPIALHCNKVTCMLVAR